MKTFMAAALLVCSCAGHLRAEKDPGALGGQIDGMVEGVYRKRANWDQRRNKVARMNENLDKAQRRYNNAQTDAARARALADIQRIRRSLDQARGGRDSKYQVYRLERRDYLDLESEYRSMTGEFRNHDVTIRLKNEIRRKNGLPPLNPDGSLPGAGDAAAGNSAIRAPDVGVGTEADRSRPAGRGAEAVGERSLGSRPGGDRAAPSMGDLGRSLAAPSRTSGGGGRTPGRESGRWGSPRAGVAPARDEGTEETGLASPDVPSASKPGGPESGPIGGKDESRVTEQLRLGERALTNGDFGSALKYAEKVIALDPRDPKGYVLKSTALSRLGRYEEAEAAARKAIKLDPGNKRAYMALSWALLHLGKEKEALDAASEAIRLDPKDATAYVMRAFAYERLGMRDKMIADLRIAARLDPVRFSEHLRRALAGEVLFKPDRADSWKLLQALPPPSFIWTKKAWGALLLMVGLGLLFAYVLSHR